MNVLVNRILSALLIAVLFAGSACAAGVGNAAVATKLTTLREALKDGALAMKVKGDGQTTMKVELGLKNKTDHPLRIVIPANEILLSHSLSVQNMMVTADRIVTVPAGGTVTASIPTACVSTKSVPPPPAEEMEFTAGNYPDESVWKQLASIAAAARILSRSGAYDATFFPKERREQQIMQLAIWLLLGRKSGKAEDRVTADGIGAETLAQMGKKREQFSQDKLEKFDRGIDEIFAAVDLTLKKSAEPQVQQLATLPGDSRGLTFNQVGARAMERGDFTEAEELLTAAVDDAGSDQKAQGAALQKLAECYLAEGKPGQAADFFKRAVAVREKALGPDFAETGESLNGLGLALKADGKTKEAIETLQRAVAVREKSLGAASTPYADSANNLALAYLADDRFDDAEKLLRRSLLIRYKNLGKDSVPVAETHKNLGDVYSKQGKWPLAETSYKHASEIAQRSLEKSHPYIGSIADGLAQCYRQMGRSADADDLAKAASAIQEKALGSNMTLIAMVPQDASSFERLALYSSQAEKMEVGVKELVSSDRGVQITSKPASNRPVKDKWALVIGISKFKDPAISLKYAAKDAQDFASYLTKEGHFAPDHVHTLIDDSATRETILAEIGDRWLPRVAGPDDLVLIYVSSHGSPSQADVRGTNYLVAHNTDKNSLYATGIAMPELTKMIKERVHSDRIVLLLDACHSGAANPVTKGLYRQANFDADAVLQGSGQLVICSSEPSQTSWESSKYPNGVFTHHLIEGLRKQGEKTTLATAFEYLRQNVEREVREDRGEEQRPVLKTRWEGNDLLLAAPPAEPRAALQK